MFKLLAWSYNWQNLDILAPILYDSNKEDSYDIFLYILVLINTRIH